MWCKNIAGRFFGLVTKHACDGRTDGQTDGPNYDSQDRASIARAVKTVGDEPPSFPPELMRMVSEIYRVSSAGHTIAHNAFGLQFGCATLN